MFDVAIVGGGILGSCTALFLARGGMRVVLLEQGGICMQASGRNAGTLTLLYAREPLIRFVLGGKAMWENTASWLGAPIDHHDAPGVEVAFTEAEAELLEREMILRREAGLPIEIVHGNRAREIEPALSTHVRLAAVSLQDGYAASNLVGGLLRAALTEAGVEIRDGAAVTAIEPSDQGFTVHQGGNAAVARRLLVTTNVWARDMLTWLGMPLLPIEARVSQVIVTERMPPILRSVVRVVSQISLKQTSNGTFIISGGAGLPWYQNPDDIDGLLSPEMIVQKLQIAGYTIPGLAGGRMVRTWHGIEGYSADNQPVIGPVPNVPGAFVMACLRSGFTTGPFVGRLMAQKLLGHTPETELFLPEFAPGRLVGMKFAA